MIAAMSTGQCFWKRMLLAAAVVVFAGQPALAADANAASSDGWFDPQNPAPSSSSAAPPPAPAAAPEPSPGDERPSLAPSPLLEGRGGPDANAGTTTASDVDDRDPRALSEFRPQLDPYGSWVQHPTYGMVWVPSPSVVGNEFTPYLSNGRWALDDSNEWIWVSDYPFGGVVFHYGRWVWVGGAGWAWVPGYRYAPAWVSWRVPTGSYAYVGWAPLGPSFIWYNGYASAFWYGVPTPWYYCSSYYVFHPHVHYYVVHDRTLVTRLNANTRVYVPASGVGVRRVSTLSGPSLAAARVPAQAVPAQRVRATPFRSPAGTIGASPFARAGGGRVGATARYPATSSPAQLRPERFRAPPDIPRAGASSRGSFQPTPPRSFSPPSTPPRASGRFAPEPSAPRLAPSPLTPRFRPSPSAPRISPAPSQPRSFSPAPPAFRPSQPRSFSPAPRSFSPAPRSFSPAPRSYSPPPRSFSPPPRSFSPPPRSFSPGGGGGGFHPRGRR